MQLARFLNSVFKKDGFILEDAYSKNYIIGSPESDKPIKVKILAVSYTHLRAHETRHDLVCRLLLEKKK